MAAFTTFDDSALARYISMFGIGDLSTYSAIDTGIENSNYFVTTEKHGEQRQQVLTIMEGLSIDELPFFNALLTHLDAYGLPVPAPLQTLDGMTSTIFCGKPTALFPKLKGEHITHPDAQHCYQVGNILAQIHGALATLNLQRDNPFNIDWMATTIEQTEGLIPIEQIVVLNQLLDQAAAANELPLPKGIIHGDLFRDNALFDNGKLSGVIDFYHACDDFFVQDLAITINDWCKTASGMIDETLKKSLVSGYESKRTLEAEEIEFLPLFQKIGAARFALTRLLSGDDDEHLKDPQEFLQLLTKLSTS